MDLFYDDIGASIDAVIVHVEAAIQATRCNPTFFSADAIEQSHRASGILSTLLNFNFFKRSPHAILSTCAEALHVASSQMQLRVSKCPSAHPIDDVPSHCIDQYTTDELVLPDRENIKYNLSDIIGNDTAKAALLENIILPLTLTKEKSAQIFKGIRASSGNVLLYGPPGCGKTMLTQAAASDSKAKFYSVRPSDILSKYQGESERYLSNLFTEARSQGRAIIFFDEFDCIAITRGCSEEGLQCRRLLSELLLQLTHQQQLNIIDSALHETATSANTDSLLKSNISDDNISNRKENSGKVIVVAATNRLQDLDEAVVRRFDTKVYVGLPDTAARKEMVRYHLRGVDSTDLDSLDWQSIADMTLGWSGSEIESLCREGAMYPLREELNRCNGDIAGFVPNGLRSLTMNDFEQARSAMMVRSEDDIGPIDDAQQL